MQEPRATSPTQPKDSLSLADAFLSELGAEEAADSKKLPPPPALPPQPPKAPKVSVRICIAHFLPHFRKQSYGLADIY